MRTSARSRVRSRAKSSASSAAHCSQCGANASPSRSMPTLASARRTAPRPRPAPSEVGEAAAPLPTPSSDQQRQRAPRRPSRRTRRPASRSGGSCPADPRPAVAAARRAGRRPPGSPDQPGKRSSMCTTRAPGRRARGHRRRPASSCPTRPGRRRRSAGRRRASAGARSRPARRTVGERRTHQASPRPAVGRHRVDDLVARRAGGPGWCARRARRTWRAGTTPSRRSAAARAPEPVSGVCTSPAPSSPVRCRSGAPTGSAAGPCRRLRWR